MNTLCDELVMKYEPVVGRDNARVIGKYMRDIHKHMPENCTTDQYVYVFTRIAALVVDIHRFLQTGVLPEDDQLLANTIKKNRSN